RWPRDWSSDVCFPIWALQPPRLLLAAPPVALLEDDLVCHDHVADHPLACVGEAVLPVAEAVVGDDVGVQLAGEGEDEVVRVRPRSEERRGGEGCRPRW